jgi:beta-glucosidase
MPVWFTEMGGFEKRANVKYFVRFAQKVFQELGREFRYVITINEPETYMAQSYMLGYWPPMKQNKQLAMRVYLNLATAHRQVYRLAHDLSRKYIVGLAKNCVHHYAGDDARVSKWSATIAMWGADYFFLDRVKNQLDFLGLNYYFTNRYYGYKVHNKDERLNDLGWDMQPQDIEFVLERLYKRYKIPIMITENGVADRDDDYRKWWIMQTLMAMNRAIQKGVKLEGYLHWSLIDNFEWASGFWPRFGLIAVDYKTQKRRSRKSAVWLAGVIKKLRTNV